MIKNRLLTQVIQARIAEKSPFIQVVLGPRQVGKTTALKAALPAGALYESADSPTLLDASIIESWWKQAAQSSEKILAIDEVQKIPGWTEVIKKLWDAHPHQIKLIVTGSSALLMEKNSCRTL